MCPFKVLGRAGNGSSTVLEFDRTDGWSQGASAPEGSSDADSLDWVFVVRCDGAVPFEEPAFDVLYINAWHPRNGNPPQEALNRSYVRVATRPGVSGAEFQQLPNPMCKKPIICICL